MFFQRCEIAALSLTIDYRPRRVNVAALRAGSFVEVKTLVLPPVHLSTCAWSPNCFRTATERCHREIGAPRWTTGVQRRNCILLTRLTTTRHIQTQGALLSCPCAAVCFVCTWLCSDIDAWGGAVGHRLPCCRCAVPTAPVAAARSWCHTGQVPPLLQVLNLVPWGGVQLRLPELRLSGVQGWGGLAAAAGQAYLQDIAANQVMKCAHVTMTYRVLFGAGCNMLDWC